MLEVANLAVAVTNMVASVYLAFLAVRFTAKPRIKITLAGEKDTHRLEFTPGETVDLLFVLTNIGYWYAHPTALDNTCYLNFDPRFELIEAKYGSILENSETNVRRGKNNCQYLKVSGIQLSYGEPGELILALISRPKSQSFLSGLPLRSS